MADPMVRMCGEVLRVNLDSSLSVRCSRTPDAVDMALKRDGVEIERSLETFLKKEVREREKGGKTKELITLELGPFLCRKLKNNN